MCDSYFFRVARQCYFQDKCILNLSHSTPLTLFSKIPGSLKKGSLERVRIARGLYEVVAVKVNASLACERKAQTTPSKGAKPIQWGGDGVLRINLNHFKATKNEGCTISLAAT